MQSASHAYTLDLCTRARLAHCILLTLDHMMIPGVVIISGLVIIPDVANVPGVVIIPDLDWCAGVAGQFRSIAKQEMLHTKQGRVM